MNNTEYHNYNVIWKSYSQFVVGIILFLSGYHVNLTIMYIVLSIICVDICLVFKKMLSKSILYLPTFAFSLGIIYKYVVGTLFVYNSIIDDMFKISIIMFGGLILYAFFIKTKNHNIFIIGSLFYVVIVILTTIFVWCTYIFFYSFITNYLFVALYTLLSYVIVTLFVTDTIIESYTVIKNHHMNPNIYAFKLFIDLVKRIMVLSIIASIVSTQF
ncbi:hypothetical protein QJ850_gp245 [Acanthamoeba polyphaga mimivirus]|uniref:Uncharacterized protein n=1 Tax=Acanthamoeba polyphaga mimivirus Kroon TaxID=3069720 RepID=A0A0G2Y790_9VIRU|nr:hypothetical protein QJ850_gp245 [Acanthamoeba polyphaga mimivirus]AKI80454.1 hypothetical protein [Acanthamoeba polyphaga mimivirus Kroon]